MKWNIKKIKAWIRSKPVLFVVAKGMFSVLRPLASFVRNLCDFRAFQKQSNYAGNRFSVLWKDRQLCLNDRTDITCFDRHYIYHTAWAARVLAKTRPDIHVDVSSSLYFATLVSAFVPIRYCDFRPPELSLGNLSVESADLTSLHFPDKSIQSLSCMHVVEHIGLGRYGDPIDPDGDLKAISELTRVLASNGNLLFVVPVGQPKIKFNAHRIYSVDQVLEYFKDLNLKEFSLIPNDAEQDKGLIINADKHLVTNHNYACGCFWFTRGK